MKTLLDVLKTLLMLCLMAFVANAEPRVDNVLIKMVPPGVTSLVGARMDPVKASEIYRRLVATQRLPQLDAFAEETGFDPRRDVSELLWATAPVGSVLLARGSFHINQALLRSQGAKTIRHGEYTIWAQSTNDDASGFCILDSTLAVAGGLPAVKAALDEWKAGSHTAAEGLIARVKSVDAQSSLWGVSTGVAGFLADNIPNIGSGIDFSRIFRGLDNTWFEADVTRGLRAEIHGTTARDQDAVSLRDAVRGLIGMGRLSVPNDQQELLKLWDGITVEQTGRTIVIQADIPADLVDKLVDLLTRMGAGPGRPGRRVPI